MLGLFAVAPPVAPLLWFALMLALLFSAYSFLTIAFYAARRGPCGGSGPGRASAAGGLARGRGSGRRQPCGAGPGGAGRCDGRALRGLCAGLCGSVPAGRSGAAGRVDKREHGARRGVSRGAVGPACAAAFDPCAGQRSTPGGDGDAVPVLCRKPSGGTGLGRPVAAAVLRIRGPCRAVLGATCCDLRAKARPAGRHGPVDRRFRLGRDSGRGGRQACSR